MTIDDSTVISIKENGKVQSRNGVPVMKNILTKALGRTLQLDVILGEINPAEFDAFILASDGFYELNNFDLYARNLIRVSNMNDEALKIQRDFMSDIRDDASFSIIRFPNQKVINLRNLISEDQVENYSPAAIFDVLELEFKKAVLEKDSTFVKQIIGFMESKRLFYTKPKMIEMLEFMIQHQSPESSDMTGLIKKL